MEKGVCPGSVPDGHPIRAPGPRAFSNLGSISPKPRVPEETGGVGLCRPSSQSPPSPFHSLLFLSPLRDLPECPATRLPASPGPQTLLYPPPVVAQPQGQHPFQPLGRVWVLSPEAQDSFCIHAGVLGSTGIGLGTLILRPGPSPQTHLLSHSGLLLTQDPAWNAFCPSSPSPPGRDPVQAPGLGQGQGPAPGRAVGTPQPPNPLRYLDPGGSLGLVVPTFSRTV